MGMREEPGIIETIESFVDTIDTTTMTPRFMSCIMTLRLLTKFLGSLTLTAEKIAGPGLSVL